MIDIYLASRIARFYSNRAKERGQSSAGAGTIVFVSIIGTEIGVGIWGAKPTFESHRLLLWLVVGWLIGAGIGYTIGALLTSGPIVERPVDRVEGRECFECRKEIVDDDDGVKCVGCKHSVHHRCLPEHARAHRAYERARLGLPQVIEADPDDSGASKRPAAATSPASTSASEGLAGIECAQCQREIVMRHQGMRCETCSEPLHRACAGPHRATHLGPFRRAASGS